ncbi:hypothetical protein ALC62_12134 [Cyphomyrmex costatus]|uniref:Uncharacterized protein n=1 Tax=Cyphomyrmex costatus TaxID=456900 RepID=A0A151IBU2_9HYME|nr:hypothetical protein ALC62_12134 [Cyphomyrmex costatus]
MEPYSRRVTQWDERRHGKRVSRSGEEEKREDGEKHEEAERRFYSKCTIFSKHMVKRSKILDIAYYERVCARCMPRMAMRLYANNEVTDTVPVFTVRQRYHTNRDCDNRDKQHLATRGLRLSRRHDDGNPDICMRRLQVAAVCTCNSGVAPEMKTDNNNNNNDRDDDNDVKVSAPRKHESVKNVEHNDTGSWLGNEANSIIERKRQIAPRNRKPIIELVHEDDPASPIYYAKHFGPGRRSVTETGSIAKKHPNKLDHAKIKSDAYSKGSTSINSQTTLAGLRI